MTAETICNKTSGVMIISKDRPSSDLGRIRFIMTANNMIEYPA
jgi:hypothetical protein